MTRATKIAVGALLGLVGHSMVSAWHQLKREKAAYLKGLSEGTTTGLNAAASTLLEHDFSKGWDPSRGTDDPAFPGNQIAGKIVRKLEEMGYTISSNGSNNNIN